MIPIKQVIMTENRCYKRGEKIVPRGIVVHSTAANNPYIKRYVQPDPDGTIGKNTNGNHWNQAKADKCMHGFLGKLEDGTLAFAQNLPWDYRCWGCGGDDSGSYNDSHIQFEICEDGLDNEAYYRSAFDAAAEICAMLCRQYGIRTRNIVSHKEANEALYASDHVDPHHWMMLYDDKMDAFRARVAAMIGEDNTVRPTWEEMRRDTIRKGAKSHDVAEMQGILISLGYDVGNKGADGVYGSATQKAVKKFQGENELTPDGVAGPATWQKALELIAVIEDNKPSEALDEPQEPSTGNVAHRPLTIEQRVMQLELAVFGMEFGGESDG